MSVPVAPPVLAVGVGEFCRLTSLKRTAAYALINSRAVESVLVGRRRLILRSSIDRLLNVYSDATR